MPKNNYSDQRKKAATALRTLGTILSRKRVCADTSPLSAAADQCANQAAHGEKSWGYDIANLVFQMHLPKGTIPGRSKDFRVELRISIIGRFDGDLDDQFVSLEINLEKYVYSADGVELKAAWHFDRHLIDTKIDNPRVTDDVHPLYHFQFGGARMSKVADRLGDTFLLDPPRLMHPPMDGILAVDFVLANYAGTTWKTLRDDPQYTKLIAPQLNEYGSRILRGSLGVGQIHALQIPVFCAPLFERRQQLISTAYMQVVEVRQLMPKPRFLS
jgi:hypothetical protein